MTTTKTTRPRPRLRWLPRLTIAFFTIMGTLLYAPAAWLHTASAGHLHELADAPRADVAIVFGAQLTDDGRQPRPFLRGRLVTTAALVHAGRVRAVLISGDANGGSGNEIAAMRATLVELGVDARRVIADPYGLDTYDTCHRARHVYGVRRALLVTQSLHLPRAVTLCRHHGIDADGVRASCDDCAWRLITNTGRELPAGTKAGLDVWRDRPPAVRSSPDPALDRVLG